MQRSAIVGISHQQTELKCPKEISRNIKINTMHRGSLTIVMFATFKSNTECSHIVWVVKLAGNSFAMKVTVFAFKS